MNLLTVAPIPPQIIETERLIIRIPRAGDGVEMSVAIAESLESLRPWMEWAQTSPTPEQSETFGMEARLKFLEGLDFGYRAFRKADGRFAVGSGLHVRRREVPSFEIGYWCRTPFQNQGYVTEAVRALTQIGFTHLNACRIQISCDATNHTSRRVAERCGYTYEGTLRNDARTPQGALRDTLVFAMLPENYVHNSLDIVTAFGDTDAEVSV